ncbi:MAG: HPF/RaiA family ribosome-associated protein [Pseudomonadota bacterium]|nr:HPF/RaiA family ribosome-associated protein [Pseudomonadota bacterium]
MKVILNTDNHVQGDEPLADHVDSVVDSVLGRFSKQITRVEVHLSDANGGKAGNDDKHCVMEARLEGLQPIAVENDAENMRAAISGAAHKLKRALDSALGKLAN